MTTTVKFELIELIVRKHNMKGMISYFCKLASVNRNSYYAWLKAETNRMERERKDEADFKLIKDIHDSKHGKLGGRAIKMILENVYGVVMNLKKIYRLMKKYNLQTKIRRANPYKKIAKATQEHNTCPNLLNRQFVQTDPGMVLLTDITYLYLENGTPVYLSCVKDGTTREILAHYLSTSLEMSIVYRTLEKLIESLEGNVHPEAILHSDQGVHYTHPEFQKRVKKLGFILSMSRKGNCWDNAPMESFFGHMKDNLDTTSCRTLEELQKKVEDYVEYYNSFRYQWGLKRMTPEQFRGHLLAA